MDIDEIKKLYELPDAPPKSQFEQEAEAPLVRTIPNPWSNETLRTAERAARVAEENARTLRDIQDDLRLIKRHLGIYG